MMKLIRVAVGGGALAVLGAGSLGVAALVRRQLRRELSKLRQPAVGVEAISERFARLRELMDPRQHGVLEAYQSVLATLVKTRSDGTYVEERVTPVLDELIRVLETGEELDLGTLTDEFGRMTGDVLATVADKDFAQLPLKESPRVVAIGR